VTSRLAAAAISALAAATFGAFFIAQRLKHSPTIVQQIMMTPLFSPNSDGRHDAAHFSFKLRHHDDVTAAVVDDKGDVVRTLLDNRPLAAGTPISIAWDGRTGSGLRAPDGRYRLRINLRRQGRSVVSRRSVVLDITPPHPVVTAVTPNIFPARGAGSVIVRFRGPAGFAPRFTVYRTDRLPARVVAQFAGTARSHVGRWDGLVAGRKAPPGTYLISVEVRDRAGNRGSAPAQLPPRAGEVQGHAGVTIRYVGAQQLTGPTAPGPGDPVLAGRPLTFGVDARGRPYAWSVRRVGAPAPRKRGVKTSPKLTVHAPGGASGVYLLEASRDGHATRIPFAVQGRKAANVLLVLPWLSWQGANPVDGDGDGIPNALPFGEAAPLARPFAAGGLPDGFVERTAPLLVYLDRQGLRYDIATDLQLAGPSGPGLLRGRSGVLLAGDERWLPLSAGRRLRSYVQAGGAVASVGIDSLRRQVVLAGAGLERPTAPAAQDVFGSEIGPLVRRRTDLLNFPDDKVGLFAGTAGGFPGYDAYEPTRSVRPGRIVAAAGPETGRPVIVAVRLGKGLVVRYGLPAFTQHLSSDPNSAALMRRTWTLLSR
jgi:hypothetical protein